MSGVGLVRLRVEAPEDSPAIVGLRLHVPDGVTMGANPPTKGFAFPLNLPTKGKGRTSLVVARGYRFLEAGEWALGEPVEFQIEDGQTLDVDVVLRRSRPPEACRVLFDEPTAVVEPRIVFIHSGSGGVIASKRTSSGLTVPGRASLNGARVADVETGAAAPLSATNAETTSSGPTYAATMIGGGLRVDTSGLGGRIRRLRVFDSEGLPVTPALVQWFPSATWTAPADSGDQGVRHVRCPLRASSRQQACPADPGGCR